MQCSVGGSLREEAARQGKSACLGSSEGPGGADAEEQGLGSGEMVGWSWLQNIRQKHLGSFAEEDRN